MKRQLIIASLALVWTAALSQDLHTEITVDRTVLPDVPQATRPSGLIPSISMPQAKPPALIAAEYTGAGKILPEVSPLPAARWADTIAATPYRGYVSAGYFPLYHVGVSAGYRIIDTNAAQMGVWAQFNGNSHNGDIPHFSDALFTTNLGHGGIYGVCRLMKGKSKLSYNLGGMGGLVRVPYYFLASKIEHCRSYTQQVLMLDPKVDWEGSFDNVHLKAHAGWEKFKLGSNLPVELTGKLIPGVTQDILDFGLGLGLSDKYNNMRGGVDFDVSLMHTNQLPKDGAKVEGSLIEMHVLPYLGFGSENVTGRLGLNLSIASGEYDTSLSIAPDVTVAWTPIPTLTLFGGARGGETLNRMSEIFEISPYVYPSTAYGYTKVPVEAYAGVHFSPLTGLRLSADCGYALVRDFLTPYITVLSNGYMTSAFQAGDVDCWYAGARASYSYSRYFSIEAGIKAGGSNTDANTWYGWRDGADNIADALLTVKPTAQLDLSAGFELRAGRKAISVAYPFNASGAASIRVAKLSDIRNLHLRGDYRVTSQITAFVNLDNLLGQRYLLVSGMPAARVTGLVGASYNF